MGSLKSKIVPTFFGPDPLSVFNANDFYARLHRVMSLLDEENIKILQTMKQFGPRNLQQVARKSKLPYSTVYSRVAKLQSLSALRTWAHPSYSQIGLVRAMVLARAFPGKEYLVKDALAIPGYWTRIIRCIGDLNGYYSLHAIPAANQQDFQQYLDQLVTRGIAKDYKLFWLEDTFSPIPNFEYYDVKERNWRFDWKEWLRQMKSGRVAETKKSASSEISGKGFDKKDLIILKELQKDARITLADLSKLLDMTLPATKYRFDRLVEEGYVGDHVIDLLPFVPEVSELDEVRLDFADAGSMRNCERVLAKTPFTFGLTPIRGMNSLTVRIYIPRQETNNLLGLFSSLAREGILVGYSYLQLDPSTQQTQTFSYETYSDTSGWLYDNREYLQEVGTMVANWTKREIEPAPLEASRPAPFSG